MFSSIERMFYESDRSLNVRWVFFDGDTRKLREGKDKNEMYMMAINMKT